jgi:hypothetical protein
MLIWADFPSGQKGLYGTSTANMLNGVWAQIVQGGGGTTATTLAADPDPNIASAGYVLKLAGMIFDISTNRCGLRFALPTPAATEGFACRMWLSALPVGNDTNPFISFRSAANAVLFSVRVLTNGSIEARSVDSNSGTLYGATTGPVVTANAWHHIEVKGLADASAGTIQVRVNGVTVLDLDTLNTGSSLIGQFEFGQVATAGDQDTSYSLYWKDVLFWDTTGSSDNDFFGSVSVYDLIEDGDIDLQWTPSSGSTGFNLVNEGDSGPVDTGYISADATPPGPTIFSMTGLPADVTSVRALIPIARMEKTDGGDCNVQMGLSPEGTNWDDGSDRPITSAFTYWWDVSAVSPATSAAWTPVEVNALEFRIDRTT